MFIGYFKRAWHGLCKRRGSSGKPAKLKNGGEECALPREKRRQANKQRVKALKSTCGAAALGPPAKAARPCLAIRDRSTDAAATAAGDLAKV